MLGVVEGGDSTIFREKSAKHVASKNVDGMCTTLFFFYKKLNYHRALKVS